MTGWTNKIVYFSGPHYLLNDFLTNIIFLILVGIVLLILQKVLDRDIIQTESGIRSRRRLSAAHDECIKQFKGNERAKGLETKNKYILYSIFSWQFLISLLFLQFATSSQKSVFFFFRSFFWTSAQAVLLSSLLFFLSLSLSLWLFDSLLFLFLFLFSFFFFLFLF